jgi:hypothetical protein
MRRVVSRTFGVTINNMSYVSFGRSLSTKNIRDLQQAEVGVDDFVSLCINGQLLEL